MKRAGETEETAKNRRQSGASSVSKNARANGSKSTACGTFRNGCRLPNRKQTPADLRKEIGRLSLEFINCEE